MKDPGLICIAGMITICYGIYMVTIKGDGVVFASVVGSLCAIAGVFYQRNVDKNYVKDIGTSEDLEQ